MEALDQAISAFSRLFPEGSFLGSEINLYAAIGIFLGFLAWGGVGVLVVGYGMAFFSDALAHSAFAGVSLGLILAVAFDLPEEIARNAITGIMVVFGVAVGVCIAFVRERTGLASDTVIGVFFAFAVGIGAILLNIFGRRTRLLNNIESFIFGSALSATTGEILVLAALVVVTAAFLFIFYNDLVLASVHPSLALSRGVRVRLLRYLLIVLLGILVNLCLRIVGILLINGLLIVLRGRRLEPIAQPSADVLVDALPHRRRRPRRPVAGLGDQQVPAHLRRPRRHHRRSVLRLLLRVDGAAADPSRHRPLRMRLGRVNDRPVECV